MTGGGQGTGEADSMPSGGRAGQKRIQRVLGEGKQGCRESTAKMEPCLSTSAEAPVINLHKDTEACPVQWNVEWGRVRVLRENVRARKHKSDTFQSLTTVGEGAQREKSQSQPGRHQETTVAMQNKSEEQGH